jgi:hypothetical protein
MKISPAGSLWLNGFVAADLTILLQLYGAAEFREPDREGLLWLHADSCEKSQSITLSRKS